jgi:hypothetical protein
LVLISVLYENNSTYPVGAQKYWRENRVVQAKAENEEARAIAVLRGEPGYNIHGVLLLFESITNCVQKAQ